MGSKHSPPRWWRDYDAECAAYRAKQVIREERYGDLLYREHADGTVTVLNMAAIHKVTFIATLEG